MKRINRIMLIALLAAGVAACSNNNKSATKELEHYVDSADRASHDYSEQNWQAIESGYNARVARAEAEADKSENDKKQLEDSRKKYDELKAKYDAEMQKRNPVIDSKLALRNSLFGEGKVGDDMSFSFVTAGNILTVYQSFVDAVDANKERYSREDWDEIKLLYEALDAHKNSVEKDLPSADNLKIAELKLKMAGMYTANRPGAKATENEEAKQ